MPPAGFLYLKLIGGSCAADGSADLGTDGPFALLASLLEVTALLFWRSNRASSVEVFRLLAALGTSAEGLRCGGMADFGVSGLVAV
jgi:hypothetical protein